MQARMLAVLKRNVERAMKAPVPSVASRENTTVSRGERHAHSNGRHGVGVRTLHQRHDLLARRNAGRNAGVMHRPERLAAHIQRGDSGKVKRIRHDPHVSVAPCTARAKPSALLSKQT